MAYEVVMPQMGADMKEGTLIRWLKKEGDEVQRGDPIAEIETDKANIEIEAFEGGVFRKALANPGDVVAVGQVIAVLGAADEDISKYGAPAAAREREPAMAAAARPSASAQTQVQEPPGRGDGRVHASPVARRMAEEKGVDLAQVHGTGPEGRITREDVEAFLQGRAALPPPPKPAEARPEVREAAPAPVSRMRQAIARRMAASKREAPHYYVAVDIEMTEAQRFRAELNAALDERAHISVNDLLVKASALALQKYPMFNSWFVDEQVQPQEAQNVCIAIALEEGLIAPAILDCGHKSLAEIALASRSLAERAKSGALKPDEYAAGTFTVSNLGMYGIDELIAIIQPPQAAILGVGRVKAQPVAHDGAVEIAEVMRAALSGDHRVTDGALGAQFLGEIKRLLESPVSLLL
ncbi:MAG: dihydrolipoamide acetyltransferase family protein [Dehalococcoidia bacterium]|jgi:pyruvate dehydrogenase E2 component (dihydrolipoamide acetyltransferase)